MKDARILHFFQSYTETCSVLKTWIIRAGNMFYKKKKTSEIRISSTIDISRREKILSLKGQVRIRIYFGPFSFFRINDI